MSIHGIDVSRFQGSIDWEAVTALTLNMHRRAMRKIKK